MAFKSYTKADLANFSGRPAESYTDFAETSAIPQALLLFKIGTCLAAPDALTDTEKELVDMAITAMADSIFLSQRYQEAMASPFNSESIGSYSYSKAAKAVAAGQPTGVMWFDLAVNQVSVCDDLDGGSLEFGGVESFEHDGRFVAGSIGSNIRFLSPAEVQLSEYWGYDPNQG